MGQLFLLVFTLSAAVWGATVQPDVYFRKALPQWAKDTIYEGEYLDIDQIMKDFNLSRMEGVEIQNQIKDILFTEPKTKRPQAFLRALKSVQSGKMESGWKPLTFEKYGDFVVALDMDETLLMQWYGSGLKGFFDFKISNDIVGDKKSHPFIKLTPGVEAFLRKLKASPLCKGIVAFSAKADKQANEIYKEWKLSDGKPVSDLVPVILTRNHLILGKRALIPTKDLRIFDETLQHVVLVDDNPVRVLQPFNLKAQPPFDADQYFEAKEKKTEVVTKFYDSLMNLAADEILEASVAAEEMKIPFSQSYLPYSYGGERIYRSFLSQLGSEKKAREATRRNPHLREAVFVTQ